MHWSSILCSFFQLVEKLSAVAPDGQTKVKVLGAIAKEHNIKWDSQLFEEKVSEPADDLLVRENCFPWWLAN